MNNFTVIDNSLICNIKISDGAYRLFLLLLSMCYGDKDFCFPSQAYLAVALGRSVRTIQRYIKELEKNNLIVRKRRGSISNIYTVIAKKIKQAGEKVTSAIKKVVGASKQQNKGNKKPSGWNLENERNYNFDKLEEALLGQGNYDYEELLE